MTYERTPEALAAADERLQGTVEAIDRELRDLSDQSLAWLAEDPRRC